MNCKTKRDNALRSRWTMIGIAKKCKNERVYALRDRWTEIGIAKKNVQK